ncbi:MAG: PAS domain S-box protein [Bacteroidales bacterium]|nr:PAS domain S-box protein [Bacteroidales bacterium]
MTEAELLRQLTQSVNELLGGDYRVRQKSFPDHLEDKAHEPELRRLHQSIHSLLEKFQAADTFILNLSKGNLDAEAPKSNQLISPFKELQSNLRHLVWQTHRIADGDYSQRIDFLGEFSTSYNNLISSLREKQALEKELASSEEKYRMLAQNVSDVIWKVDLNSGKYSYVSPSIFKLHGYTVAEALQFDFSYLFTTDSRLSFNEDLRHKILAFEAGDESARSFTVEMQQVSKDKTVIWVESVVNLLQNQEGKVTEILGVTRNIEKRKEAEQELKNTARELKELNATKDKFFSIIAHDLRNPFNALLNLTQFLIEYIETDNKERAIEMAGLLKDSSLSTYNLLQNLLEWSMIQQGGVHCNPAYEMLLPLVEEELEPLENMARQKKIELEIDIANTLVIKADKNMLKTILRNLISNALKYTYEGGNIMVRGEKKDNDVLISIRDSGTGMNPDEIKRLFRLNTEKSKPGTRQEKGSGLGLILCREFVTLHGGKVWVESEPGKGSTFFVSLPL